ncbi:MAG: hypothetical protein AAF798_14880 [Bacteroidota bacterium]
MTRFREFAYSPYFNKHEGVKALIDYLWKLYPDFTEKRCDRHKIFATLFPEEIHNQAKLAVLFTYALRLLQQFLQVEVAHQHSAQGQLYLLQALRDRQQHPHYEKILAKTESMLEKASRRDSHYFRQQFLLATEADAYYTDTQSRKHDHNIQWRQNNLDRFYLAEKLRDACEMHVRSQILKVDYSTRLWETVLREVKENLPTYQQVPAIYIYFLIYQMLTEQTSQHYFEALNTLKRVASFFELEEQKTLYNYLQNYCIHQINTGNAAFLQEIFHLYKMQLEGNLMIEEGYLSEWHYKNIVTTGIRLNEMDWVFSFIETYKHKLEPEAMDNAYRFNLASYYYATQQYDQVLSLLLQVEYSDLRYSLGAKALLLRTYYDLEETEALLSLCDSFRQYLLRNKLMADNRRVGYSNLFKLTKRAAILRSNIGFTATKRLNKEMNRLKTDIDRATIFNRLWLVQKWEELDKSLQLNTNT